MHERSTCKPRGSNCSTSRGRMLLGIAAPARSRSPGSAGSSHHQGSPFLPSPSCRPTPIPAPSTLLNSQLLLDHLSPQTQHTFSSGRIRSQREVNGIIHAYSQAHTRVVSLNTAWAGAAARLWAPTILTFARTPPPRAPQDCCKHK